MERPDRRGHVRMALRVIGELGPVPTRSLTEANANLRRYLPMLSNACWIEEAAGGWVLTPDGQRLLERHAGRVSTSSGSDSG